MFYHLLYPLASEYGVFNVFRYITFRTGAATLTALFISFLVGPALIRMLERLRVGQPIREDGPDHRAKAGTPTMGGLLILLSLLVSVLLWSNLDNGFVWTVIGVTASYGLLGFIDDYAKVTRGHSAGISARMKLLWQTLIAVGVAVAIYNDPGFDAVLRWRLEQEHKLRQAATAGADAVMTDAQVTEFIQYYERITRNNLEMLPSVADAVIKLGDESRQEMP